VICSPSRRTTPTAVIPQRPLPRSYWYGVRTTLMVGCRMPMVGSRGRCRGRTGGRSSLLDGGVRLICEGLATSRPGIRRGSLS